MEENTSRPLIIAAGIILAMLIIALAFTIYNVSKDTTDDAVGQISNLNTTLSESEFTQWEGDTVTGAQVVSIIKQFQNETCGIIVENGSGTEANYGGNALASGFTTTVGTLTTGNAPNTVADATNKAQSTTYITPSAQFYCTVIRDSSTEAIVGLYFKKQ